MSLNIFGTTLSMSEAFVTTIKSMEKVVVDAYNALTQEYTSSNELSDVVLFQCDSLGYQLEKIYADEKIGVHEKFLMKSYFCIRKGILIEEPFRFSFQELEAYSYHMDATELRNALAKLVYLYMVVPKFASFSLKYIEYPSYTPDVIHVKGVNEEVTLYINEDKEGHKAGDFVVTFENPSNHKSNGHSVKTIKGHIDFSEPLCSLEVAD